MIRAQLDAGSCSRTPLGVGCDIYRINTAITQGGSKVDAGFFVDKRDRQTRKVRWEQLDEVLAYDASSLDRDKVFTEMFPGRTDLPKTLIFAKDDTHADDIVRICREVFGKGNDFCQKITYRTGFVRLTEKTKQADGSEAEEVTWKRASSLSPEEILSAFRNSYFPRIAVTVDMIRLCREAGLREPDFAIRDGFVQTLWRPAPQTAPQATTQVAGEVTGEVTGEVAKLLLVCRGTMTRKQMREMLLLKGDDNFRQLYLTPALEAGWIEMTIPDKPTSRLQKYRLTDKGRGWLAA